MSRNDDTALERLGQLVARARSVLVFTGAGVSTGSGIPDFRGPGGLWTHVRPVLFADFLASEEARVRHWELKRAFHEQHADARPNAAHRALADLERLGHLDTLVTQNVDGLHVAGGVSEARIVEIHGTNRLIECLGCGRLTPPAPALEEFARTRRCPRCEACGGLLKSATVSFGQAMPEAKMERAFAAAARADLALSIGSTLEVQPAALVPLVARDHGARYGIVNRGPTAHDDVADVRLEGDVCELLPRLVERVVAALRDGEAPA